MFDKIYRKTETKELPECGGTGNVYEHIKTGAKIFTLKTCDPNKVFMIGFRTTPADSTGAAHIMEHSVLCGSEKFPLRDPFVELAKGSLNTFLNAMTYPDKTVYPVASCNDKDFMNLMDVYLDAVFHPNIYHEKKIFLQEGWHYEPSEDGSLRINGVVYNEMKGAFSNPDSVLERYTLNALFPETTYAFESGGDPDNIPDLTYEGFLRFHETYYHPSNSYIYLYGDMDMEKKLLWIDEHYLSRYEKKEMDTRVLPGPEPEGFVYVEKPYAVSDGDETKEKTYISENYLMPVITDSLTDLAWEVLEFVLLSAPGAPLREELMKRGIGEEIYGGYCSGTRQPYFSVTAKNSEKERMELMHDTVMEVVGKLCTEGIDGTSLNAALNYLEFKYREEDFGRTPAGLSYGLSALESWLYELPPYLFLTYQEEFKELRRLAGTGYYEKLLSEVILNNDKGARVVIVPEKGLTAKRDAELKEKLSAFESTLSEEEKENIIREAEALTAYQEEEDSEEALKCLPVLSIDDIEKKAEKTDYALRNNIIYSAIPTHGIAYMRLVYDITGFTADEAQQLSFVLSLLGELDTKKHTYKELSDEMLLKTGGIDFSIGTYLLKRDENGALPSMPAVTCEIRTLTGNIGDGIRLAHEMLNDTLFDDSSRILEKLLEAKARMQAKLEGASHLAAVTRCQSYTECTDRFADLTGGIAYHDFLSALVKKAREEGTDAITGELRRVAEMLKALPYEAALTGNEEMLEEMSKHIEVIAKSAEKKPSCDGFKPLSGLNEGLRSGSQVNYVARTGRYVAPGEEPSAAMDVLRTILNYDYLWINLRVKGGAYGCMSGFSRSGKGYLVSYRDPGLSETDDVYEGVPDFLSELSLSEDDLRKYIIGTIAGVDQPVTASVKAARELSRYYAGITDEDVQRGRDEILACSNEVLRGFAENIRNMLAEGNICVVGNSEMINDAKDRFGSLRELLG